jgi:hypothetical protein
MLELVTIFLATFLISTFAVWLYRKLTNWQGFNQPIVGRRSTTIRMQLKAQQGYISLFPASKSAKRINLHSSIAMLKTPWGW